MYLIEQTEAFVRWRQGVRDPVARTAIRRRMWRMGMGTLGDVKPVGEGISEARVDVGAGYRLYFTTRGRTVIFLLCGGSKSTQDADIKVARKLAKEV
jgi:putative addiction module killer protein